jgi:hypothetical protein
MSWYDQQFSVSVMLQVKSATATQKSFASFLQKRRPFFFSLLIHQSLLWLTCIQMIRAADGAQNNGHDFAGGGLFRRHDRLGRGVEDKAGKVLFFSEEKNQKTFRSRACTRTTDLAGWVGAARIA